jgi:hypothetical protein
MIDYKSAEWIAAQATIDQACNNSGLPSFNVQNPLLSAGSSNAKQKKLAHGLRPAIVYLSPATIASDALQDGRDRTNCPHATAGCIAGCLNLAGRGVQRGVRASRMGKAILFLNFRQLYLRKLRLEVARHVRLAERDNVTAVLRHNGTSDIPIEDLSPDIYTDHKSMQAMDYTKNLRRMHGFLNGRTVAGRPWPANYHLCFSRSENTPDSQLRDLLSNGGTVAVVFRDSVPARWLGYPVADATVHDWRWRDAPGTVQGLIALGPAAVDKSGFVVDAPETKYRYFLPEFVGASATGRIR